MDEKNEKLKSSALRSARMEISLSNILHNIRGIQKIAGKSKIIAIVKADAYGHGAAEISTFLADHGIDYFAIATLKEGIELRNAGLKKNIILLSPVDNYYADIIVKNDFIPTVSSLDNAKALSKAAKGCGKSLSIMIALDTGMGRIGYLPNEEAIDEISKIAELDGVHIKGIASHLSSSPEEDKSYSYMQLDKFNDFTGKLKLEGINPEIKTIANSGAIVSMRDMMLDAIRPGILIYGYFPEDTCTCDDLDLKPALSVKANIIHMQRVKKGFCCSYGRKFVAKRDSIIGTIPVGYADGYPANYSGNAKVIVNGKTAPIAGAICMDLCMIDLTDIENSKVGDEVILLGSDGKNTITALDIEKGSGMFRYEILTGFGQRLPKQFI